MFRFKRDALLGVTVLRVEGSLDAMTANELKAEVIAIADAKTARVVVDLEQLTLIDSSGVGVLISLFKRVRAHGGAVAFAGMQAQPKEIFRLLRLDRSLDVFPTVNDAVQKLSRPS